MRLPTRVISSAASLAYLVLLSDAVVTDKLSYRNIKLEELRSLPQIEASNPSVNLDDDNDPSFKQRKLLIEVPIQGSNDCPCLTEDQIETELREDEGQGLNISELSTYGVGCRFHDQGDTTLCKDACSGEDKLGFLCQKAWCNYAWCWVDPNNCKLDHIFLVGYFASAQRHYSYATCRYPDVYTHDFSLFGGTSLKVGMVSNTGGWKGAYSATGESFVQDLDQWRGPAVEYIRAAASLGNLSLASVTPPIFLTDRARSFFGSSGSFDLCVYAASLGFVDLCVGEFSVTAERAAVAEWITLETQNLFMIGVDLNQHIGESVVARFGRNIGTIFQPFNTSTWMFVVFAFIPCMGILFVMHDYGKQGSTFPTTKKVVRVDLDEELATPAVSTRNVSIFEHCAKSVYVSLLSVLQMGYGSVTVSFGAKIHLIGFGFFILTILAVYTANLAAILSQQNSSNLVVSSFEDAINKRVRFCASRKHVDAIVNVNRRLDKSFFVQDPTELGGDGRPGFDCPQCNARSRVFDFVDVRKADQGDQRYCHAAIAPLDDLEVFQSTGQHCDKSAIGGAIGSMETGFPIYEGKKREFTPLLLKIKNNGVFLEAKKRNQPLSACPILRLQTGETASLTFGQLSGIWTISFGFALLGLIVSAAACLKVRKNGHIFQSDVIGHDQKGHIVNLLRRGDEWVKKRARADRHGHLVVQDRFDISIASDARSISFARDSKRVDRRRTKHDDDFRNIRDCGSADIVRRRSFLSESPDSARPARRQIRRGVSASTIDTIETAALVSLDNSSACATSTVSGEDRLLQEKLRKRKKKKRRPGGHLSEDRLRTDDVADNPMVTNGLTSRPKAIRQDESYYASAEDETLMLRKEKNKTTRKAKKKKKRCDSRIAVR